MKPTLLILAAGMGSRYGGLKQIDPLGPSGETIIDYSVYDAARAGFGKVVFVIRQFFEDDFKDKVSNKYKGVIEVEHVYQELDTPIPGVNLEVNREKPWGTGHATLVAKEVINEPFIVINADDYYGQEGFQTIADFLSQDVAADHYCMLGFHLHNTLSEHGTVSRGVCTKDDENLLVDVVERTKIGRDADGRIKFWEDEVGHTLNDETIVSMNFWGFYPNVFEFITDHFREFARENQNNPKAEFYIPLFVNKMLKEGAMKMSVLESSDKWFGVTYKEDKPHIMKALRQLTDAGNYPSPLWQ